MFPAHSQNGLALKLLICRACVPRQFVGVGPTWVKSQSGRRKLERKLVAKRAHTRTVPIVCNVNQRLTRVWSRGPTSH